MKFRTDRCAQFPGARRAPVGPGKLFPRKFVGAGDRQASPRPGGSKPPPRTPSLEICLYATVSAPVPTPLPQHLLPAPKSVHRRPAPVTLATVTVSRASAPSNPQPFGCQLLCHHSYYCFKIQFRQFRGSRDGGGFMGSGANLPSPSNRRGQDTWTAVATNEHAPTQQMSWGHACCQLTKTAINLTFQICGSHAAWEPCDAQVWLHSIWQAASGTAVHVQVLLCSESVSSLTGSEAVTGFPYTHLVSSHLERNSCITLQSLIYFVDTALWLLQKWPQYSLFFGWS